MKAIKFKDSNTEVAKNQKQYHTMNVCVCDDDNGTVVSCWKMSFWERVRVLFSGRIYMSLLMFGQNLTPSRLGVNNPIVYNKPKNKISYT